MEYETIYEAIYGYLPQYKEEAQEELATMSNDEWYDWVEYRNDRRFDEE